VTCCNVPKQDCQEHWFKDCLFVVCLSNNLKVILQTCTWSLFRIFYSIQWWEWSNKRLTRRYKQST
jgi:hypothetical protein